MNDNSSEVPLSFADLQRISDLTDFNESEPMVVFDEGVDLERDIGFSKHSVTKVYQSDFQYQPPSTDLFPSEVVREIVKESIDPVPRDISSYPTREFNSVKNSDITIEHVFESVVEQLSLRSDKLVSIYYNDGLTDIPQFFINLLESNDISFQDNSSRDYSNNINSIGFFIGSPNMFLEKRNQFRDVLILNISESYFSDTITDEGLRKDPRLVRQKEKNGVTYNVVSLSCDGNSVDFYIQKDIMDTEFDSCFRSSHSSPVSVNEIKLGGPFTFFRMEVLGPQNRIPFSDSWSFTSIKDSRKCIRKPLFQPVTRKDDLMKIHSMKSIPLVLDSVKGFFSLCFYEDHVIYYRDGVASSRIDPSDSDSKRVLSDMHLLFFDNKVKKSSFTLFGYIDPDGVHFLIDCLMNEYCFKPDVVNVWRNSYDYIRYRTCFKHFAFELRFKEWTSYDKVRGLQTDKKKTLTIFRSDSVKDQVYTRFKYLKNFTGHLVTFDFKDPKGRVLSDTFGNDYLKDKEKGLGAEFVPTVGALYCGVFKSLKVKENGKLINKGVLEVIDHGYFPGCAYPFFRLASQNYDFLSNDEIVQRKFNTSDFKNEVVSKLEEVYRLNPFGKIDVSLLSFESDIDKLTVLREVRKYLYKRLEDGRYNDQFFKWLRQTVLTNFYQPQSQSEKLQQIFMALFKKLNYALVKIPKNRLGEERVSSEPMESFDINNVFINGNSKSIYLGGDQVIDINELYGSYSYHNQRFIFNELKKICFSNPNMFMFRYNNNDLVSGFEHGCYYVLKVHPLTKQSLYQIMNGAIKDLKVSYNRQRTKKEQHDFVIPEINRNRKKKVVINRNRNKNGWVRSSKVK